MFMLVFFVFRWLSFAAWALFIVPDLLLTVSFAGPSTN
jgi:hypothetical protein